MRAAVYFGRHDVRIIDFQEPPLTDTGVKVAVSYCGLCGTDLHKYDGLGPCYKDTVQNVFYDQQRYMKTL